MKEEDVKFGQVYEDRDGHLYTVAYDPDDNGALSLFDHTDNTWFYLHWAVDNPFLTLKYDIPGLSR